MKTLTFDEDQFLPDDVENDVNFTESNLSPEVRALMEKYDFLSMIAKH